MKTICVFCSARDVDQKYVDHAIEFGKLIGSHGYDLVWGGSDTGMMKTIADSVQESGGKLIGISMEYFSNVARKNADEMIITPTLGERKRLLLERGDAIVLLIGGIGSLDEISEIIDIKKLGHHQKPIVVLNSYSFYDGLKTQLLRMHDENFIPMHIDSLMFFAETPQQAIEYIDSH